MQIKATSFNRNRIQPPSEWQSSIDVAVLDGDSAIDDPGTKEDPDARFGPFHKRPNYPVPGALLETCDPKAVDPALG